MFISDSIESYLGNAETGTLHTRRTYRTALNLFREYLEEEGLAPESKDLDYLDVDRLLAFATWLLDRGGLGQRTLHTYLAALVGWVSYLQVRGWLPFNSQELARLQDGVKRIRRNQRPPELLPYPPRLEEMEALVTGRARDRAAPPRRSARTAGPPAGYCDCRDAAMFGHAGGGACQHCAQTVGG